MGTDHLKRVIPMGVLKHASDLRRLVRSASRAFNAGNDDPRVAIGEFGGFTVAYRPGTSDEDVLEDSFGYDSFFRKVPDFAPKSDDVILDVGAHIGTFSLLAAAKVPNGRVFAIEASQETFDFLRINVALNKANIKPVHLALYDRAGMTTLHHDRGGNWGHSIMMTLSPRGEQVPTSALVDFCDEQEISRIALMKVNCEGAEFPILLGTPVRVLRNIDLMLIEYHLDMATGYSRDQLIGHLHAAGFATKMQVENSQRGCIVASRH